VKSTLPAVQNIPIPPPMMKVSTISANIKQLKQGIAIPIEKEEYEVNIDFKDTLNKKFVHSNTVSVKPTNPNHPSDEQQPKQIKLDNFVKENYNMFDVQDEDEEDISTLFRKNTIKVKKTTLFENKEDVKFLKVNLFNEEEITITKEKEKPKQIDLESIII
jgi:hypothetical protein